MAAQASPAPPAGRRPRLAHIDAMRPVKQAVVITTHSVVLFAPAASSAAGAVVMTTHVGRFAFMFISAAMLVYAYPDLKREGLKTFWRRRLLAVAIPYVTWTVIYFFMESIPGVPGIYTPTGGLAPSVLTSLNHLFTLLVSGYYQLYFLLLLLEFYIVYPLFLWVLQRGRRHPWALLGASLALQVAVGSLIHWGLMPNWASGGDGLRELWNYQFFLVLGGLMALHYHEVHAWLCRHRQAIVTWTVAAFAAAEGWYWLGEKGIFPWMVGHGDYDGAYQPVILPLFVGLIGVIYLVGVLLAHPRAPAWVRQAAQKCSDNSYGIYLAQVMVLTILYSLGWGRLSSVMPWGALVAGSVIIVFGSACALTSLLAHLPGARATAGRPRQAWGTRKRPSLAHLAAPVAGA